MRVYTQEDCVQQNLPENLMNRVLVLPENETGQLFFVCAPWARSNGCKSRTCPGSGKCIAEQQGCLP